MKLRHLLAAFLLASVSQADTARAELVHGFVEIWVGYDNVTNQQYCATAFDFRTQSMFSESSVEGDICYYSDLHQDDDYYFEMPHGGLINASSQVLEEISMAPETWDLGYAPLLVLNKAYVVKTQDGLYAKIAPRKIDEAGCCHTYFEYFVQMDGTRNLDTTVATQPATWSRVKALYRR